MAFYKLFYIVHRRTDWLKLYHWQRELIMPEVYEAQRKRGRDALAGLLITSSCIQAAVQRFSL